MNFGENHSDAAAALRESGCALLSPHTVESQLRVRVADLTTLQPSWDRLPRDEYLRDGGRYRFRRHSCFTHDLAGGADSLRLAPHRAHWQPTEYNALHGGMERWFEPIEPAVSGAPVWNQLVRSLGTVFARVRPVSRGIPSAALLGSRGLPVARWYIEAHQFRIDTAAGIGRPTPEGAHRDGVDYVAVILVSRVNVRGGETRVFQAQGTAGVRFTMTAPWTALLLDDATVIHETTPIQPEGDNGVRDTLVLTYREGGFQAKPA